MSLEEKIQKASGEYQKVQLSLTNVIEMRERLEAQLSENELVKKVSSEYQQEKGPSSYRFLKEFATLTEENTVFKLIGPVLVKQDQAEAKSNVDTRLGFIRSEMYVG